MPSIVILYDPKDHTDRALAMKNTLNNEARVGTIDARPVDVTGLKTLIIWGHGSHTGLCNKTGKEIVAIIAAWKAKNPDLKTVEIITCNSMHFDDSWLTDEITKK